MNNLKKSNLIKAIGWISIQIYCQNIFQMIDILVIGIYNEEAVSAINIAMQPVNIVRKFMLSIILGYTILSTRTISNKKTNKQIGGIALFAILCLSFVSTIVIKKYSNTILFYMLNKSSSSNMVYEYLSVVSFSIIFQNLNILFTAILRCHKYLKWNFGLNIFICILNLILDILSVCFIKDNVLTFVALSTILAQGIGSIIMFGIILKKGLILFTKDLYGILDIFKIGIPASIDSLVYTVAQSKINSYIYVRNPLYLTAFIYMIDFSNILTSIAEGAGNAMGIEIGHICESKDYKKSQKVMMLSKKMFLKWNFIIVLVWGVLIRLIIPLFDFSHELNSLLKSFLIPFLFIIYYQSFNIFLSILLKNSGDSCFISILSVIAEIGIKIILSNLLLNTKNVKFMICILFLLDEFIRNKIIILRLKSGKSIKNVIYKKEVL